MAAQLPDRGHPAVSRGMCVHKMIDENGHQRLVINAPDETNSLQVAEVVNEIFSQKPEDLANCFKRSATLVQLVIYMFTAASDTKLIKEMREMRENLNALYLRFRSELQGLMVCSFDMFELFTTACYYFDEGRVELGKERLEEMTRKSTHGKKIFGNISEQMLKVQEDVKQTIERLTLRRAEFSEDEYKVYSVCLSMCTSGVMKIACFLDEQTAFLTEMQRAFDLENRCKEMQGNLDRRTFQELTDNVTPGGFMYIIHATIVRCTAAKKVSKAYTEELIAKSGVFDQMMSTTPTTTMAQQEVNDMMVVYNQEFPEFAFRDQILARIQAIDWTKKEETRVAPSPEKEGRPWCVLI